MTISHFFSVLIILGILCIVPGTGFSQEKTRIRKIVIDAGHGGKDPGAIGRKAKEKTITLSIALKLGKLIRKNSPDIDVVYTRDSDVFVELYQRAGIANHDKADLFISIHCNANPSHSYQGAETYVMGLHKTRQNLEISKLENASILMEPDYLARYDGFDPGSDESYITFTLFQNAYLNQSTDFAAEVQNEMKDRVGMDDRGVRQAGFLVLYKTTMPAVLVETGFLSNPIEESYLMSETGQDHIAGAIFRAIMNYKNRIEKSSPAGQQANRAEQERQEEVNDPPAADSKESQGRQPGPPIVSKEKVAASPPSSAKKEKTEVQAGKVDDVWFCVQVATSPTDIGVNNPRFKELSKVSVYKQDGLYKYTVGHLKELSVSFDLQKTVCNKGFKDAFVVAFQGEKRITVQEAKQLISRPKTR